MAEKTGSGTPRTDEMERVYNAWIDSGAADHDMCSLPDGWGVARTLERELAEALAALEGAKERWVPAGDGLPNIPDGCVQEVLIATPEFVTAAQFYQDEQQFWTDRGEHYERHYWDATHWMPLPKGPS